MKAATAVARHGRKRGTISIHAAREGGDCTPERQRFTIAHISIHAAREGGDFAGGYSLRCEFISIHAAREGGDSYSNGVSRENSISIHAAREGGDDEITAYNGRRDISIHAAREGGDPAQAAQSRPQGEFQSTPPVKAATATEEEDDV